MLAEDYFGFLARKSPINSRRALKRTQLSEQKMNTRRNKKDETGLEDLKKKYNEIFKKNKNTNARKRSTSNRIVEDHYYHGCRMAYYHKNDEQHNSKTRRVKQRVEAKALLTFQRNKTETENRGNMQTRPLSFQRSQNKINQKRGIKFSLKERPSFLPSQRQSSCSKSYASLSSSKHFTDKSVGGRALRKLKKEEKEKNQSEKSEQKYDDYSISSMKIQSQISENVPKRQCTQKESNKKINSIKKEKKQTSQMPMISVIGLNSKVSENDPPNFQNKKDLTQKKSTSSEKKNISSDYEEIKRLEQEAKKSIVNILKYEPSQEYQESESAKQQFSQNNNNQFSQRSSSMFLSNVIAQSARIFNPNFNKKKNEEKCSYIKNTQKKKISQIDSQLSSLRKAGIQPPKMEKSGINLSKLSKLNYNQSKCSSIIYNNGSENKQLSKKFKYEPSQVEQFHSSVQEDTKSVKMSQNSEQNLEISALSHGINKRLNFNLVQSIRFWSYHEKNQTGSHPKVGSSHQRQFSQLMDKIHLHLRYLQTMTEFVEMTVEMYNDCEAHWIQLQSFLLYKWFYIERIKIYECLKFKTLKSCFNFEDAQIQVKSLVAFKNMKALDDLKENIDNINTMIFKSLKQYREKIYSNHQNEKSLLSLSCSSSSQLYKAYREISKPFELLNEELQNILPRLSSDESEDRQIICLRGFKIMELVFFLSQLLGRKVKKMQEEQIDDPQEFELYCKQHYGQFKQTILFFT